MSREVLLKVNDEVIRTNAFVKDVLAGILQGFLAALDDVPQAVRKIEVIVEER